MTSLINNIISFWSYKGNIKDYVNWITSSQILHLMSMKMPLKWNKNRIKVAQKKENQRIK